MKRFLLVWVLSFVLMQNAKPCGLHNYNSIINPFLTRKQLKIAYSYIAIQGIHYHSFDEKNSSFHTHSGLYSNEIYQTLTVDYQNPFSKMLMYHIRIPIAYNYVGKFNNLQSRYYGVGDINVGMSFFKNAKKNNIMFYKKAGIDLNIPAQRRWSSDVPDFTMIPSSGALGILYYANISAFYKSLGVSSDLSYKMFNTNYLGYKFANRFNFSFLTSYRMQVQYETFLLSAGYYTELAKENQYNTVPLPNTGGWSNFLTGSVQWGNNDRYMLSCQYYHVLHEKLNGTQGKNTNRVSVTCIYLF
jgi:hypothetical protein